MSTPQSNEKRTSTPTRSQWSIASRGTPAHGLRDGMARDGTYPCAQTLVLDIARLGGLYHLVAILF